MTKFDARLQQALEQIEAGVDPQAALTEASIGLSAQDTTELAELVRLAVAVRDLPAPQPIRASLPASVISSAHDLRQLHTHPRFRWREAVSQAYVIGFAALMLAIFAGVFIVPSVVDRLTGRDATPTSSAPTPEISTTPDASPTLATSEPTPTTTVTLIPLPPPLFELPLDAPILTHSSGKQWDARFTDPGAVIVIDDALIMFRNGSAEQTWPLGYMTGLNTSTDGLAWEAIGTNPVFKSETMIPYSPVSALVSSALVELDSSVSIYFYTYNALSARYATSDIGHATATTPSGPFTVADQPVLRRGGIGAWDSFAVRHPSVIHTEDGYLMLYTGVDAENNFAIGAATSPDGLTWTKYDDPTTDGAYAESDPVFVPQPDSSWESRFVSQPNLVQTPDGLIMLYRGAFGPNGEKGLIGIARSEDGLNWTRYAGNPVFDAGIIGENTILETITATYFHDTLYLFVEIFTPPSGSSIWVATHQGDLP